jgi:hypothetical protein
VKLLRREQLQRSIVFGQDVTEWRLQAERPRQKPFQSSQTIATQGKKFAHLLVWHAQAFLQPIGQSHIEIL